MNEETVNQDKTTETEEAKTFTQEEVNHIVGKRVAIEAAKYADFDELKAKAAKFDEMEEANKSELEKAREKATALEEKLKGIEKAESIRQMKEKVSEATGVPVSLITAEAEDEAMEQAQAIKQYATPNYPTVRDSGETNPVNKAKTRDQFAEWFNSQTKS